MAMHRLPDRSESKRLAVIGIVLFALGLGVAVSIAVNLAAANARDLPVNSWFWNLGQTQVWPLAFAQFFSWFADGPRNIVIAPLIAISVPIAPIAILFAVRVCLYFMGVTG